MSSKWETSHSSLGLLWNADTGIADDEVQLHFLPAAGFYPNLEGHFAVVSELDCITQQSAAPAAAKGSYFIRYVAQFD